MLLKFLVYVIYVAGLSTKADRQELIKMAQQHEKESLHDEDEMIANHLRMEGFRVEGPIYK